ncbi:mpv17-like protein 2 [Convolutriloba macropyga]|uniref:mpv17-like protein 2 n=1 Tax=Convolutriloba macropyga TaxID=536237 RepID=UPI003F52684E
MATSSAFKKAFSGKYLWVTNFATSFTLTFLGDTVAQHIEAHRKGVKSSAWRQDLKRSFRMASMNFLLSPWQTGFYLILDKRLPGLAYKTVLCKLALDELNAIPLYMAFITILAKREGRTWSKSIEHCKEKFLPVYTMDLRVWPFAQFVNFCFIPSKFRVSYVNIVTFLWDIFFSVCVHKEKPLDAPETLEVTEKPRRKVLVYSEC